VWCVSKNNLFADTISKEGWMLRCGEEARVREPSVNNRGAVADWLTGALLAHYVLFICVILDSRYCIYLCNATCLPSGMALGWYMSEGKVISVLKHSAWKVYGTGGAVHISNRGSRLGQCFPVTVRQNVVKWSCVKWCNKFIKILKYRKKFQIFLER
jgi:hypothetical protein